MEALAPSRAEILRSHVAFMPLKISQLKFYCIFAQINAALGSWRDWIGGRIDRQIDLQPRIFL